MAKNPQFPTLDELWDHFPTFFDALKEEQDVSVALLIGSYIDSLLYGLLQERLASENKAEQLLEVDGPLGNSFRRASLAYCIGMLSGDELNLIQQICGIRNKFAHGWKERLTFESEGICKACAALEYRDAWIPVVSTVYLRKPIGNRTYDSLRDRFIRTAWELLVDIMVSRVLPRTPRIEAFRPQHRQGKEQEGT